MSLNRLLAAVTLAAAGSAFAAPPSAGHGHGPGMMMFGGPGMGRMLDQVSATAEQRSQIDQIMGAARADLQAQHGAGQALHEQAMQLFSQPTVDANAAEALRRQMLTQHDRASQRMMQAMLEVSRVLTPEQRRQMAELAMKRGDASRKQRHEHRQERQPKG